MIDTQLPPQPEMLSAFLSRDAAYDGVFVTAVKTTGIFCRPTCPARKPRAENVEFFPVVRDALLAGYRPCKRCRPLEPAGAVPTWLRGLLDEVEADPLHRWTDADMRKLGISPERVRRWFQSNHGMTFHAYNRARRLGLALGRIRTGSKVTEAAFDHGYDSLSGFNEAFQQLFGVAPGRSAEPAVVHVNRLLTPLGPMVVCATEEHLCLLEFADRRMLETQLGRLRSRLGCVMTPGTNPVIEELERQLTAYFEGNLHEFTVPYIAPGSDFQQQVWTALEQIPYGETATYVDIARQIGRPTAVRAVGRANGDNRLSILIPCHRVVGSNGKLTGYGGGLWRKQRLLELEAKR